MTAFNTTKVSAHEQDGAVTDIPDPAALPTRRQITVAEKLKFLQDFEALSHGDKGEFLRVHGLYSSQISEWRRLRDAGTLVSSASRNRSENREIEKLTKKNQRLEDELERTRLALDIMGKAHALLEKLSKSADTE